MLARAVSIPRTHRPNAYALNDKTDTEGNSQCRRPSSPRMLSPSSTLNEACIAYDKPLFDPRR
jgi:hypothetical protein